MGAFYIASYGNSTKFKATVHNHIKGQGPGISPGNYSMTPGFFHRKQKEKKTKRTSELFNIWKLLTSTAVAPAYL